MSKSSKPSMAKFSCDTCMQHTTNCPLYMIKFPFVPDDMKLAIITDSTKFVGCMSHQDSDYKLVALKRYVQSEITRAIKDYQESYHCEEIGTEAFALQNVESVIDKLILSNKFSESNKIIRDGISERKRMK